MKKTNFAMIIITGLMALFLLISSGNALLNTELISKDGLIQTEAGTRSPEKHNLHISPVFQNQPPVIEDQFYSNIPCNLKQSRHIQITAVDPDGDPLTFTLLDGIGVINPNSGMLTYIPDTSGVFIFEIAVYDSESGDTATVKDSLVLNTPPLVICNDSVINLCQPQEICFDVFATDPDGDFFDILLLEGVGDFIQVTDTSGTTCFFTGKY